MPLCQKTRLPLIGLIHFIYRKGESATDELAGKQKRRGNTTGLCGALREEGGKRWLLKARRAMQKEGVWWVRISGAMGCKNEEENRKKGERSELQM